MIRAMTKARAGAAALAMVVMVVGGGRRARSTESVLREPQAPHAERGLVIAADVAGGWTQVGFRYGAVSEVVSAPAIDVRATVGYRIGAVEIGVTAGELHTAGFNEVGEGQPTPRTPASLQLAHAGVFAGWHPSRFPRLVLQGRLEAAYGWLPGLRWMPMSSLPLDAFAIAFTGTTVGGTSSVALSYLPVVAERLSVAVGCELFAGELRGSGLGTDIAASPRGAAVSVALRWH